MAPDNSINSSNRSEASDAARLKTAISPKPLNARYRRWIARYSKTREDNEPLEEED